LLGRAVLVSTTRCSRCSRCSQSRRCAESLLKTQGRGVPSSVHPYLTHSAHPPHLDRRDTLLPPQIHRPRWTGSGQSVPAANARHPLCRTRASTFRFSSARGILFEIRLYFSDLPALAHWHCAFASRLSAAQGRRVLPFCGLRPRRAPGGGRSRPVPLSVDSLPGVFPGPCGKSKGPCQPFTPRSGGYARLDGLGRPHRDARAAAGEKRRSSPTQR
jgi:hypothetical protein